jgi:hypothetical protein
MTGCLPCLSRASCAAALALAATLSLHVAGPSQVRASQQDAQSNDDYDCTDFDSQDDAQAFYEAMGGPVYDPYNLDDDGDGVACEEWAHQYDQNADGADDINGRDGVDKDCADFPNQPAAQRYFQSDGGSASNNVDHLDPNHNGLACEKGEPG